MKAKFARGPSTGKRKNVGSKHGPFVPKDIIAALRADMGADARFAAFSHSHKREYIKWITEAKRPETREKRIAEMLNRLKAGKQKS
jgi:uncharacterized protein YdeI (YjbR/CyaY-like superfamily)